MIQYGPFRMEDIFARSSWKTGFLLMLWELLEDMLSAAWLQAGFLQLLGCDDEAGTQRRMYVR